VGSDQWAVMTDAPLQPEFILAKMKC